MMKKFLHSFWILACVLCIVFYSPQSVHSNQDGAPTGKTGSPGDGGSTCSSCHSGGLSPGATDIFEIIGLSETYVAGESYSFIVSAMSSTSTVFGFELKAEDNMGNSVGEIILTDPARTQLIGNGTYLTHTEAGSTVDLGVGFNLAEWTFDWQTPIGYEGAVTFYAACNVSNGNGTSSGDVIMTDVFSIEVIDGGGPSDVSGCTNPEAINYNPFATVDDGSCVFEPVEGVYIMGEILDVFTCDGVLYDSGGAEEDFILGESSVIHIYPEQEGASVQLFFEEFDLGFFGNMTIYDGDEEGVSPILVGALQSDLLGQTWSASEDNESGCLTIEFNHNPVETSSGWTALISCIQSTDANCLNLEAINYNANAIIDDGSCEFNISSSEEITTCGGTLYDSGGPTAQYTNNENQIITIYPENEDEYVSLFFSEFQLETCCDYVTIYDGESVFTPELVPGSNGTSLAGQTYYASPTNETGALTITFTSDASVTYLGWAAEIGCTTYGPCFGFDVTPIATYETDIGTADASAYINITLGNEPFDILWSTGETTETISGLTAGSYSVTISDSEGCVAESFFEVIVDPLEYNIDQVDIITNCSGILYDSGGSSGDYTSNENQQVTIYPENPEEYVSLFFSEFQFEGCCDYLTIYDGESTNSPVLVPGSNGTSLFGQTYYASPTNESGALTITFTSDGSVTYPGWAAEIGCTTYGPCFGFDVDVLTTFETEEGTSDATAELNIILGNEPFDIVWSTSETGESISGLTAGTYSVNITDALDCVTETTFDIIVDPEEYLIGDLINLTTCNGLFYDTGGPDNNPGTGEDMFIRICPDEDGLVSQLDFTEFNVGWSGVLTIYDGMGTTNPVLATGSFTDLLGQMIVASAENSSGCLTVTYTSDIWVEEVSGWEANISCYDYIVYGCMDTEAFNYNDEAEVDDGLCYYAPGCTDPTYVEYHTQGFVADFDNGDCITVLLDDCADAVALNYNPDATFNLEEDPCVYNLDDWMCGMHYKDERDGYSYTTVSIGNQCWMTENIRYLPAGSDEVAIPAGGVASQLEDGFVYTGVEAYNIDDNGRYYSWNTAKTAVPYAWHLPTEEELGVLLEEYDGVDLQIEGETGFNAQMAGGVLMPTGELEYINIGNTNWLWTATEVDEGMSVAATIVLGTMAVAMDPMQKEFAVSIRALLGFPADAILGCTDEDYIEYNPEANYDDGTCEIVAIEGCTDETAVNYELIATVDDGSCIPTIDGCMDEAFVEFDDTATVDDGSCQTPAVHGCTDDSAQNYEETANLDDGSCIAHILGCTDPEFAEYDADATLEDGSCLTDAIFGCMDPSSFNYNNAANVDDGSCEANIEGCTDPNYIEYNGQANTDDGSCTTPVILGCTIDYALNYDPLANTDDGSCEVEGCTNDAFVEYDPNANIDNGTCSLVAIWGCTDENYLEYFPPANMDDGSCINFIVEGCTDLLYLEYFVEANLDDGSCQTPAVVGCTDPNYLEYDPMASVDNNTCVTPVVLGCMDVNYLEYNPQANTDDGFCITPVVFGCMDDEFMEYNPLANTDDESCTYIVLEGCMDENYLQYNPMANVDNNSCETPVVLGCTDALAFNYDILANTDDDSCVPVVIDCMDENYTEYNPNANIGDHSMCVTTVVLGCNDTEAFNYDSESNTNDGSCIYEFSDIQYVGFADGIVEFTPNVFGMGADYQTYWGFGDGFYSSENSPIHTYSQNGPMEVTLTVNNGQVEIITSIWIEIVNASVGIDEVENSKQIIATHYYDLMGRELLKTHLNNYQIHIQKVIYDDGSFEFLKKLNRK